MLIWGLRQQTSFETQFNDVSDKLNADDIYATNDHPNSKVMNKRMMVELALGLDILRGCHRIYLGEKRAVRACNDERDDDAD